MRKRLLYRMQKKYQIFRKTFGGNLWKNGQPQKIAKTFPVVFPLFFSVHNTVFSPTDNLFPVNKIPRFF